MGDNPIGYIRESEYRVKTLRRAFVKKDIKFVNGLNQLCIHDVLNRPLMGRRNNNVIAKLVAITDRTKTTPIFYLLKLYMNMHKTPQIGLKYFVQYLGINKFFTEDLTYMETLCLLYMRIDPSYKEIAKKLNTNIKNIETHLFNITSKLKSPYQLSNVSGYTQEKQNGF